MRRTLEMTVVEGIKTSIPLHLKILNDPDFVAGRLSTSFMDRYMPRRSRRASPRWLTRREPRAPAPLRHSRRRSRLGRAAGRRSICWTRGSTPASGSCSSARSACSRADAAAGRRRWWPARTAVAVALHRQRRADVARLCGRRRRARRARPTCSRPMRARSRRRPPSSALSTHSRRRCAAAAAADRLPGDWSGVPTTSKGAPGRRWSGCEGVACRAATAIRQLAGRRHRRHHAERAPDVIAAGAAAVARDLGPARRRSRRRERYSDDAG